MFDPAMFTATLMAMRMMGLAGSDSDHDLPDMFMESLMSGLRGPSNVDGMMWEIERAKKLHEASYDHVPSTYLDIGSDRDADAQSRGTP
jgi:hypothetical protein